MVGDLCSEDKYQISYDFSLLGKPSGATSEWILMDPSSKTITVQTGLEHFDEQIEVDYLSVAVKITLINKSSY